MSTPNQRQYEIRCTETGIKKPSLLLALSPTRSLGMLLCITTDIMHLVTNMSDLLISLWCGSISCASSDNIATWTWAVLHTDEVWEAHGQAIEDVGQYIPGLFDVKSRNLADKSNSDYKTWEFQVYTFGLGPTLLYGILPEHYWTNYCKLVRGFRIMCQHNITDEEVQQAHILLCSWELEFEEIYCQHCEDRLHFVRPCVHQIVHLPPETIQKGPPICYAQWTMERTIGNLKHEMRQPSNYLQNLAMEGVRRSRINALLAAIPELNDTTRSGPLKTAIDIGGGFFLLQKHDQSPISPPEANGSAEAIRIFLGPVHGDRPIKIKRSARLQLPNGQIARSAWREQLRKEENNRCACMIKVNSFLSFFILISLTL
jgi:hypothetical protein